MEVFQFFVPFLEIGIISVMLYFLLSFFWNTRAMDLVLGFGAFLLLYTFASLLHLPVLQRIMLTVMNVVVIAILVIFQPELRLALSRITIKGRRFRAITDFDHFLDNIANSIYRLADKRIGAIVLLENQDSLDEYAAKSVMLNANFSSELLESIFMTTTPVHDGAVIIRGTTIISAATILPLADDSSQITKSMGTRHRAALGISQVTDTLSIVISEEDGKVSVARDGMMTKGIKIDRFKGIIRSIYNPPKLKIKSGIKLRQWLRK
jgi:diadenylate cyclase